MNNDFNYNNGQQYSNPFTGAPEYDFYDELVVKDAKKATSRTMLSVAIYLIASYALTFIIDLVIGIVMIYGFDNKDAYVTLVNSIYYQLLLSTLPMYIGGIPILFLLIKRVPKKQLPLEKPKMSVAQLLMMIPIAQLAMTVGSYIGSFINAIYSAILGVENFDPVSDMIMGAPLPLLFLLTVVLAPIFEELIFRKLLLDRLSVYGSRFAILVTAVAFGLFHGNLDQFFYATLVGIVLGYVAIKSGNWLFSVIVHAVMNFLGGVVPLLINDSLVRYTELMEKMLEDPMAYTSIPAEYALDVFVIMIYSGIVSTLVIGGIVLLILGIRRRWFTVDERLSVRIPKGRTAGVVFKNAGSIILLVVSGLFIVLDLLTPLIEQVASGSGV